MSRPWAASARGRRMPSTPDWVLAEDKQPVARSFDDSTWCEYAAGVVQELVVLEAAKTKPFEVSENKRSSDHKIKVPSG